MDKVTKKQCKTRNDQMDGQVDRSNDEQCKFDVNISECFEMNTDRKIKRKKRRGVRNRERYEYGRSAVMLKKKPECNVWMEHCV